MKKIILIPSLFIITIVAWIFIHIQNNKFLIPQNGIVELSGRIYDINKIWKISAWEFDSAKLISRSYVWIGWLSWDFILRENYGWWEKPETLMRGLRIEFNPDNVWSLVDNSHWNLSHDAFNSWFKRFSTKYYFIENSLAKIEKCQKKSCYVWEIHLVSPQNKNELMKIAWKISQENIVKDVKFIWNASLYTNSVEKIWEVLRKWIIKIWETEYNLDKIDEIKPISTQWRWFDYDYSGYWLGVYNYKTRKVETTAEEKEKFLEMWYPKSFNIAVWVNIDDENYSAFNTIYITFDKHKIFNDGWDGWSKIKFHNWFKKFNLDYVVLSKWTTNCEGKYCDQWEIYLPDATKYETTKFLMEINQEDIIKKASSDIINHDYINN